MQYLQKKKNKKKYPDANLKALEGSKGSKILLGCQIN